jgi:hypothetical protein
LLNSYRNPTGTQHTATVAFLVLALILNLAVLALSRPLNVSASMVLTFSVLCIALGGLQNFSQLTVRSLESPHAELNYRAVSTRKVLVESQNAL